MVRLSNGFVAFINILSLLLSLSVVGFSVYLYINQGSVCQNNLQLPLLIIGLFLLLVSSLGLIGSCCRIRFILWIYLTFMFLLIIGLICFMIFTIIVTNKGVGKAISGRGYKEYRLGDYSNWLQNYVVNEKHWDGIKSCLADAKVCSGLGGNGQETAAEFSKRSLSPIESGCCKPPTYCGYEFKNATFWTAPKGGPAVPDTDCNTWSNNQASLCYNCKSCKAGVLANIKRHGREFALINTGVLIFVLLIYSVGCCALRNKQSNRHRGYKGHA